MKTIRARVNERLLAKASRLFTGTLQGRIIEILQNARRAGTTEVRISNSDGCVTVHDCARNGRGIDDFATLLDLGGSGWEDDLEASEDPAGVGLFYLAPNGVTIRSNAQIAERGWRGADVEVFDDPNPVTGTMLHLRDDPWTFDAVEINAVFSGLTAIVDCNPPHTTDQSSSGQ